MSDPKRPYAMDTGWVEGISGDLDGHAVIRYARQLEFDLSRLREEVERLKQIIDDLDFIRQEEMSLVEIPNNNPDFGGPDMQICIMAPWTNDLRRTFYGENLADCLHKARQSAEAAKGGGDAD